MTLKNKINQSKRMVEIRKSGTILNYEVDAVTIRASVHSDSNARRKQSHPTSLEFVKFH